MKLLETNSKFKVLTKEQSKKIVGGDRRMDFTAAHINNITLPKLDAKG